MTASRILLAGVLAIIVACILAYIPAMQAGFIWDDDAYVTANPLLTAPDGFSRIWFSTDAPSQYFPLTYSTYWVEYRLWQFNPLGYHTVNVAIHILNALLLWLILRRLSIPGAWFAAAVFALHPVNVESVAWITERKNVLMLFFSLLSVLCWMKFVFGDKSGRRAISFYIMSLLFCALALFSKATACTLPAALVLILWLKRIPFTVKRWLEIIPYVVMGLGIGLLVMWWEKHHQGTSFVTLDLTATGKLLLSAKALWFYLWKLLWPDRLTFSYPRWHIDPTAIWQYAWLTGVIVTGLVAWLLRKRIGRGTFAAIAYFAAMLFPMLGFFPLYTFVYSFVADHYQYAACIGPIALFAAGGTILLNRLGKNAKPVMLSVAAASLLTLGVLTWQQCKIYTNADTLWQDTLTKNPDSWLAHSQVGNILFKQNKFDEALAHMKRVIELTPYLKTVHPRDLANAYYNMALIFEAQGNLEEAANHYQKSLDIAEYFALVHYRFAEVLAKQGKTGQAIVHFRRALEIARAKNADYLAEEIRQRLKAVESQK